MVMLKGRAVEDWPLAVQLLLIVTGTTEPRELPRHKCTTQGDEDGYRL